MLIKLFLQVTSGLLALTILWGVGEKIIGDAERVAINISSIQERI